MRLYKIFGTLTVTFLIFLLGFIGGIKKTFPYNEIIKLKETIANSFLDEDLPDSCALPHLKLLPAKFSAVVGHAYGSPGSHNGFIDPKLEKFIKKNNTKISKLFLTGDVFSVPSLAKWDKLFEVLDKNSIIVAPGNHDILREDSREIFYLSEAYSQEFPYFTESDGINILVDDSISSKWELSSKLVSKINDWNDSLVVMRHNPPIQELAQFMNSTSGIGQLLDILKLDKTITNSNNITWVFGDGGAFEKMPRIICKSYNNHKFIINGLGGFKNDKIIIIYEGNLYSYEM